MKASRNAEDAARRSLDINHNGEKLVPIGELHVSDATLVSLLARWRSENSLAFPNRFRVTPEGTARWLRERVLRANDRLLFLITSRHGHPLGHIGIANALAGDRRVEIDSVLRGERSPTAGVMTAALSRLLTWIEQDLAPEEVFLRVLGSNEHAIQFYTRLGFEKSGSTPLRRVITEEGETLEELPGLENPDDVYLVMTYRPRGRKPAAKIEPHPE